MKRILFACLAAMMLLVPGVANAQQTKSAKYYSQAASRLQNEVVALKKEILEYYPQIGSINNINAKTVAHASEVLSCGNMMEMKESVYIEIAYSKIRIKNFYINQLKAVKSANQRQVLVDDHDECAKEVSNMGDVMGVLSSMENFGGSMAGLEYSAAELKVYEAWYSALSKGNKTRVSQKEATNLIRKMRAVWKKEYQNMRAQLSGSDFRDGLKNYDNDMKKYMNNLEAMFAKKTPYRWLANTFKF